MSQTRDALERLQARVKELETLTFPDVQLTALADALEHEAKSYETLLEKNEKKAEESERAGQAGAVLVFGFSLLFVTPIVAIIGVSLAKLLRHETEIAIACLAVGLLIIFGTFSARLRHLVAHRASSEWKRVRAAQREADELRSHVN